MEGDRARAATAYGKLVKKVSPTAGDAALARFRMAEVTAARDPAAARNQFLAVARDFPAHPLADEALRRIGGETPASGPNGNTAPPPATASPPDLAPAIAFVARRRSRRTATGMKRWPSSASCRRVFRRSSPPSAITRSA